MSLIAQVLESNGPGADAFAQQLQKELEEVDRAIASYGAGYVAGQDPGSWVALVTAAGSSQEVENAVNRVSSTL